MTQVTPATAGDHPEDQLLAHVSKVTERMLKLAELAQSTHGAYDPIITGAISRILPYLHLGALPSLENKLFADRGPNMRGGRWFGVAIRGGRPGKHVIELEGSRSMQVFLDDEGTLWEHAANWRDTLWKRLTGPTELRPWTEASSRTSAERIAKALLETERNLAHRLNRLEAEIARTASGKLSPG